MSFKHISVPRSSVRRAARRRPQGFRQTLGPTAVFPVMVNPLGELKFHDVDLDDAVIAATGTITATINIIPQGTTEVQRIGRKCTIRQINWRFHVDFPVVTTAAAANGDVVRVILYLDKQANKATAAVTDILRTADYQSFNNLNNKARFRTLMDRTYDLNSPSGAGDGATNDYSAQNITDDLYKKVNIPLEFTSTTGAIGEITSNNIGVLLISQGGLAGFQSKFRLRFSDN